MEDQRADTRKLMFEDAAIADASGTGWAPVVLLDISQTGVAFASAHALDSGASHVLRFRLPGSTQRHEAVLSIVRSTRAATRAGYRVAARLAAVDAETAVLIAAHES
jgi:hypothetical protein